MQNTLSAATHGMLRVTPAMLVLALSACSDSTDPIEPINPVTGATAVSLAPLGVQTVTGAGGVTFVNAGRYALLPQFAATQDFATGTNRSTVPDFDFAIGGVGSTTARVLAAEDVPAARPLSVVEAFHMRLRQIERDEAPRAIAYMQELRARPAVSLRTQTAQAAVDRNFQVLSSLTTNTYSTVTARLVYTGNNILLYVDNQPVAGPTFTDAEYQSFGRQFDTDLFPIDVATFGATSDIDNNGKTFVLFTPLVNRLTIGSGACGTYVAGLFNGADLSGNANANRAEIFFASVPGEPAGGPTCNPLSLATVRNSAAATFIHELQHMISYNQHVLLRSGPSESTWLNEGLSHMAEELGGKLYETRYPCPNLPPCPLAGRGSTAQIFPDSAQGFLPPNFGNAYDFFSERRNFSLTSPTNFGTTEERGVAWLFLRYLVDQKGDARLGQLVQTRSTGTANVEAAAGQSFSSLFADFLAATYLDDYPGTTAGQIPSKYQYSSRNLRAIYARLNSIQPQFYPSAYPLEVLDLAVTNRLTPASALTTRQMKPGSFELFGFTSTVANTGLSFRPPTTASFQSSLNAQVTVIRLPN
jgi:hypothetical protein